MAMAMMIGSSGSMGPHQSIIIVMWRETAHTQPERERERIDMSVTVSESIVSINE